MLKFVIDEDIPRSTAKIIKTKGHEVLDFRDFGLKGKSDTEIFEFAQREKAILFTGDLGFGNILQFPIGHHYGIVIAHFPNEMSTSELNNQISKAMGRIDESEFKGNLIILGPGLIRIRKK